MTSHVNDYFRTCSVQGYFRGLAAIVVKAALRVKR
jgi:hypothetical protein